ncbi:MAG: PAS domain S-box protein [Euryarchaeota archaeon]|nr:PAS domain S-box protein [Euryarchaeota archaeon]MBU4608364.1 PAS domain S-box protein [Euryarchaeota archaeon]MBV1729579.1 PAS domain S-box protein [Methanobacterium sp.]MBV1754118.1 PAS domain S-box protein [Methanobacterium sp.]
MNGGINLTTEKISLKNALIISMAFLTSYIILSLGLGLDSMALFSGISFPILSLIAAICLFYGSWKNKSSKKDHLPWLFFGLALLFYTLADTTWALLNLVWGIEPFFSAADIFYLAAYPCFILGIIFLPHQKLTPLKKYVSLLDVALILVLTFTLAEIFLIEPSLANANIGFYATLLSVVYVALDLIILTAILHLVLGRLSRGYVPLLFITFALVLQVFGDFLFSYQTINDLYLAGGIPDVIFIISYVFFALAGLSTAGVISGGKELKMTKKIRKPLDGESLFIFIIITFFYILVLGVYFFAPESFELVLISLAVILLLVFIRQALYNRENRKLYLQSLQSQMDLKKSYYFLQNIIDAVPQPIFYKEHKGRYKGFNQAFLDLSGKSREDLLEKTAEDVFGEKLAREYFLQDQELQEKGGVVNFESRIKDKNGDIRDVIFYRTTYTDPSGKYQGITGSITDITPIKIVQRALKESEEKYRSIVETAQEGIWIVNKKGDTIFSNPSFKEMLGLSGQEMEKNIINYMDEDKASGIMKDMEDWRNKLKPVYNLHLHRSDGDKIYVQMATSPIVKDNQFHGILSLLSDITDRKKAEKRLKSSLNEKETLLKEVHHRVKNNLQIISSLLSLQYRNVEDETARDILKESQTRVRSISLVHEGIYLSQNISRIDFKNYINRLATDLLYSYRRHEDINLNISTDPLELNIETAVPCGLVITELVSNSIKHAFPGGKGKIDIELNVLEDKYRLIIRDNGQGLPHDFESRRKSSLGLRLVDSLVDQLDGTLEYHSNGGSEFKIIFQELDYVERVGH